jgi:type II secretory ATPase GspE/PulE/Tfp pilus assembly ATPase PilB-like protein
MLEVLSDWPTPPYFSFEPVGVKSGPESCLIYYLNGKKALGDLIRMPPDESSIVFLASRSDVNETINLDQVKTIRLLRPLVMRRQLALLHERAEEVFHSPDRQTYSVEFIDKEIISGETVGYSETGKGLFLYLPKDDEQVVRCFIPKQSMAKFQIGLHLGEMLVKENLVHKDHVEEAVAHQHKLRRQRLGDYLSEKEIVSREQLEQAILHQEKRPILKLGEAMQELGLVTAEQLQLALAKQQQNRSTPLGRILVEMGVVEESVLKGALAKKLGIPYVGLAKFNVDLNVIQLVSVEHARKYRLMPLYIHDSKLVIAFEDPFNSKATEEIRFLTQMKVIPVMSSREDIEMSIKKYYHAPVSDNYAAAMAASGASARATHNEYELYEAPVEVKIDDLTSRLSTEDQGLELSLEPVAESDNTLVQTVNKIIMDAHSGGVSDIHIETYPGKKNTRIRFRKDGTLSEYVEIPANFRDAIISRIKIMAQMDISNRRIPQDGKIEFQRFGPAKIELRVVTIPTSNSLEDVVMRVLAPAKPLPLEKLGCAPDIMATLKVLVERPYGLVLVCGPTGSGKTTTLHSLLGYINTPNRKIWTVEDPVEISQAGLRQVQVNSRIGLTFASVVRSFLRADPDVIMIGEMRDQETTGIAIEASLTGHLVLSTLHTNTAPESVIRLLDLGMDPFNFADALLGVLSQRLLKALCGKCKQAYEPDAQEFDELLAEFLEGSPIARDDAIENWKSHFSKNGKYTLYKAVGCPHCNKTGYRGRVGVHELMTVSPEVRHLIQTRAPLRELQTAALRAGMRTLRQDGIYKVLLGETDIKQVRVVCA